MKRKELKQLAQKIAKLENIIQTSDDNKKIAEAQRQIIELSGHVENLDDMCLLDDMIQDLLKKIT